MRSIIWRSMLHICEWPLISSSRILLMLHRERFLIDLHIGEMTARETLEFSGRCQGIGTRYEMLAELLRREKDAYIYMKATATQGHEASVVPDYILKILGLEVCAYTMVGDDMVRGIFGGQKKHVTTGELLVGPASVLFMDEISTGLVNSTTYSIINSLTQYVYILKGTAFISLLQPTPDTYNLFDDIVLISMAKLSIRVLEIM